LLSWSPVLDNEIKKSLLTSLEKLDPFKVILFGSFATDNENPDSDLDLIVVTKSQEFPQSYQEKQKHYLPVARALSDLYNLVPIDLIVYTRPMFNKMIELQSMFAKEIIKNGQVIYEAPDKRVA
jgi:uncharacterized protein